MEQLPCFSRLRVEYAKLYWNPAQKSLPARNAGQQQLSTATILMLVKNVMLSCLKQRANRNSAPAESVINILFAMPAHAAVTPKQSAKA